MAQQVTLCSIPRLEWRWSRVRDGMAQQVTHCSISSLGRQWSRSRSLRENSIDPVYATRVIRDNPTRFLRSETLESQTTLPFLSPNRHGARDFRAILPVVTQITNTDATMLRLLLTRPVCVRAGRNGRSRRTLPPPEPERRKPPETPQQFSSPNPHPDDVKIVPSPVQNVQSPQVVDGHLLRRQGQLVVVQQLHLQRRGAAPVSPSMTVSCPPGDDPSAASAIL